MKKIFLACSLFFLASCCVSAQESGNKNYAAYPYWIKMMQDTSANFFETEKAFNTYWKDREKPPVENDQIANTGEENGKQKNIPYSVEYRKFKNWEIQTKPFVQPDGSILCPTRQRQLIMNSRKSLTANQTK